MDAALFREDLLRKPQVLRALAGRLADSNPWTDLGLDRQTRLVLVGMGSSHYANAIGAARLQSHRIPAVAALASTDLLPAVEPDDVAILVSASGKSTETLAAARSLVGRCRTIAVTNASGSELESLCDTHIPLMAQSEVGGVACRSYQHTLAVLLALEELLIGDSESAAVADLLLLAAEASQGLLDTEAQWRPRLAEALLGPAGTAIVAPARRLSSAYQSALMLREGPRLPAVGCETGDWSHVDVYLTKTTDYRMLLLGGSQWEPQLIDWCTQRGSTVIGAGADVPGTAWSVRYAHDELDDVRLLSETLITELVAADAWARA